MNSKVVIYRPGQGIDTRVVCGTVERTYIVDGAVVVSIKPDEPKKYRKVETSGEVLPTRFSDRKRWRIGQPCKVPDGWLHVFDLRAEKAHYEKLEKEYIKEQRKSEKSYKERRKVEKSNKEYYKNAQNTVLKTVASGKLLDSVVGSTLKGFCRDRDGGCLTLEFDSLTLTVSFTIDSDTGWESLTVEPGKPE